MEALDGGPGVHTRRYAGPAASDADNNDKLLRALDGVPPQGRGARYRCLLVFVEPPADPKEPGGDPAASGLIVREGTFDGRIALRPAGRGGFGYDPIFEPLTEPPGGRTVGQLSSSEKDRVSHRALAARAMVAALRAKGY